MTRPSGLSKSILAGWRALTLIALLVTVIAANLTLTPSAGAVVRDLFTNAYPLTTLAAPGSTFSDPTTAVTSFTRDSVEVNDLSTCGSYPDNPTNTYSVWYTYTPTANGWLTLSTLNAATSYDTVIEVWSGTLAAANSVGCNDDAVAGNRRSELGLPVTAATNYIIAIRRFGASTMPATPQLSFAASFDSAHDFYVNQTSGSDGNTGSKALPFRTIGKAESALPPVGGVIHIVDPGTYTEAVTVSVPTTFQVPAGAVAVTSLTLTSSPVTASGTFAASSVNVQPGGLIQNGVNLAKVGGTVNVGNGTFAENVTVGKNLTLRASNEGSALIQPAAGDAVTISGGAVTLRGFGITAAAGTGVSITGGTGHTIVRNNITGNTGGVANTGGGSVNGAQNYWGAATGPTIASNPGGTGDSVSTNVTYRPWCTVAVPTCATGTQAGLATHLVFTISPSNSNGNVIFPTQPRVEARDNFNNLDTSYTSDIALSIGANPGSGTLAGTASIPAIGGVANFTTLSINNAGNGYTLLANSGVLIGTTSATFNITFGTPDHLVFSQQPPTSAPAGSTFTVKVKVVDQFGTTITNYIADTAKLTLTGGTVGAILTGGGDTAFVNGEASFTVAVDRIGTSYQLIPALSGSALGGTTPNSTAFNITADRLIVTTSPANSAAGATLSVVVEARDNFGTIDTNFSGNISLAIQPNPGSVALNGTVTLAPVNGVATFGATQAVNIKVAGTGYILQASSTGLTAGNTTAFDISAGAADHLMFSQQPPASAQAGNTFPVKVKIVDQYDNPLTIAASAQLTLTGGTVGAVLTGGTATAFVGGEASFTVSVNKAGNAYQLVPTLNPATPTLPGVTPNSTPFNITGGPATQLVFSATPGNTRAGTAFGTQPVVEARDALGNVDPAFNGLVTLVIKTGTGTTGATLNGTVTVSAVAGVATFSGLSINMVGPAYQLTASGGALTAADSAAFNITATGLNFTVQPVTTPAGQTFIVKVAAQDASNTTDTTFTGRVTLTLKTGRGATGTALLGTLFVNAVNGVADFSAAGLNIQKAGVNYIITASTTDLPSADSVPFTIIGGPATQIMFTASPVNTPASAPLTLTVEAQDAFNNLASTYAGTLNLAIATNPGGGALGGTASKAFSGGTASIDAADGLNINKIGIGYTLTATSGSLPAVNSAAFNITASQLVFGTQPGDAPVGGAFPQPPVLRAVDSFGTLDTTFTGTLTLTIASGTGTSGAVLHGTTTLAATGGVATFSRIAIDRVGTGYKLNAVGAQLPIVTSAAFDITKARVFAPTVIQPPRADLVTTFQVNANPIIPFNRVVVSVTITNRGEAPSEPFWVDFYINPLNPPTTTNQPWDKACGAQRCSSGIAWYVTEPIAPGQSITLTSTPGSFYVKNTTWKGYFTSNNLNLYAYADSWNPGVATGAVFESDETNNRAEFHTQPTTANALDTAVPAPEDDLPALPERPARPAN